MSQVPALASVFDGLRLPVIGAPMFLVSGPELVIAQCKAGVVGAFPALNARPSSQLDAWLIRIRAELAAWAAHHPQARVAPFAVNLNINAANSRLEEDVQLCVRHRVPVVITSLSSPAQIVSRVHEYGGIVLHDVSTIRHSRKALDAGVDGLILLCAGAGGHTGSINPFALVAEVRRFYDGLLVLSGAITSGASILAAQAMGADLAYIGTRFIATHEAMAPDRYKQMVIEATAADIVQTALFSGASANYLASSMRAAGLDPDNLPLADAPKKFMRRADGPKAWKDVWAAGHGVGNVESVLSVESVVERLQGEYRNALIKTQRLLS